MIARNAENEIFDILSEYPAIGIIGPRQVGKTTLARHVGSKLNREALYLDLELPEDEAKLQQPSLFLNQHRDKCVILDEIQRMPALFPVLRSLIDQDRKPGRFILLGSASPQLIKKSSESLAGRIAYLELSPLNWKEVKATTSQVNHWVRGGFPNSLLAKNDTSSFRWRRNFIQTYQEKDLPLLGLQTNLATLRDFFHLLTSSQGQLWNAQSFAKALGISAPTVKNYLHYLENAFLALVLRPYSGNIKKRLVKSPKVYIRDTGVYHALLGLELWENLQKHVALGWSWETYVISQVRSLLGANYGLYFYRTHEGAEADLVITKGPKPVMAIEIKYSNAPRLEKGLKNVVGDLKTKTNFIITPSSDRYPIHEHIEVISLGQFLENLHGGSFNY